MDIKEIKKLCLEEIDKNREKIIAVGQKIYATPELGYKEVKSTETVVEFLKDLNLDVTENIAVTGCMVSLNKDKKGPSVAVIGELDSVVCPGHKDSSEIGNMHCCGHNIQIAGMLGCATGIINSGALNYLDGKVNFMAVPSEECIDLEFRKSLQDKKEIKYVGGKQELIYRGVFDSIDMAMMFHPQNFTDNKNCTLKSKTNGFIAKAITFIGKSSHAGISPHLGVNALSMANMALNNINAQRDTFKDEDKVRVSAIINHGGDVVNVVPARVTMESMVRAGTVEAMMDTNKKINRALHAAAINFGGKVIIEDSIGYLPLNPDDNMADLFRDNFLELINGDGSTIEEFIHTAGSTDLGDLSQLMPCLHPWIGGVTGALHTQEYEMTDEELAYIIPAKAMAMTLIDLLYDGGRNAKKVIEEFKPNFTKESYLKFMDENTSNHVFDYME